MKLTKYMKLRRKGKNPYPGRPVRKCGLCKKTMTPADKVEAKQLGLDRIHADCHFEKEGKPADQDGGTGVNPGIRRS